MGSERKIYNLCLIGFMGVGKSSTGHLAAHQLGFQYLDTDAWIEEACGKTIERLFADEGEAYFRNCEASLVHCLAERQRLVIATGGGLAANPDHLDSLKTHSLVFWLWASPEVLWERLRHQTHRPLLQTPDPVGRMKQLLSEREPVYRQADVLVNTEGRSAKEVAALVVGQFKVALGSST